MLLCYCRNSVSNGKQCHRYILADVLVKVANSFEIEAKYMGERVEYTNRPQNPKVAQQARLSPGSRAFFASQQKDRRK